MATDRSHFTLLRSTSIGQKIGKIVGAEGRGWRLGVAD
jgi:hypothetical protein